MSRHKPNTVLPKGAKNIKPIKQKFGGWVEMTFDAKLTRKGIDWYRVQGGMGHRNDREDWIADTPINLSVHDYYWNGDDFGPDYGTFENAIDSIVVKGIEHAEGIIQEYTERLQLLKKGVEQLKSAC